MRLAVRAPVLLIVAGLGAGAGWAETGRAEADLSTFHPQPRPAAAQAEEPPEGAPEDLGPGPVLVHPRPRPADLALLPQQDLMGPDLALAALRPQKRPDFETVMMPQEPQVQLTALPRAQVPPGPEPKGLLCRSPALKGKALLPINSKVSGCDVPDAVLVSEVSGVTLQPPATINCEEALALATWVKTGLQPVYQGKIVALKVADSYSCRPRNNVRGNKVSVHGLGQAIDIESFMTSSGQVMTVSQNYNAQMRAASRAGCGIFHTILGPGSDGYHENHIHFDVAKHGRRDYCR